MRHRRRRGPFEPVAGVRGLRDGESDCPWGFGAERDGVWYRVEEIYYDSRREGRQKTDAEYADMLERLAAGREIQRVIVDPSAASFIETLRQPGLAGEEGQQRCG